MVFWAGLPSSNRWEKGRTIFYLAQRAACFPAEESGGIPRKLQSEGKGAVMAGRMMRSGAAAETRVGARGESMAGRNVNTD